MLLRSACVLAVFSAFVNAQKEPFDVHALLKISRIADPQLSPDGKLVAFTVQTIDVAQNARPRQIWIVPLEGGAPKQLTREGNNERARWSPDSRRLVFISSRGGSSQIWIMNADGGSPKQVTNLATEAGGVIVSPDGRNLVFTSEVYPECADEACNKKKLDEENASKVKARIYTSLLYRHWNTWQGTRRSHLMVVPVDGGVARDLTPTAREVPPFSLGGPDDYAVSPDGKELCYAAVSDPEPAVSTNSDLWVVPIEGGDPRRITENPSADNSPSYSPDGKHLAWRLQLRAGYESDKWRLAVMDRAADKPQVLTEGLDRAVGSFTWSPDSRRLFFSAEDRGRAAIHSIAVTGGASRPAVSGSSHLDDTQLTPDGKTMIYTGHSGSRPLEIFRASASGGTPAALTRLNETLLEAYQITGLEEFWVEGAERGQVHSFVVKPPGFQRNRRYPVLFLIHGGPQGAWGESWSYRWNPQVFASAGFVVVMPNPRGSTGYGQRFTDEINADWGGKVYDDIIAVVDHVTRQSWADPERFAAAGGSYGGYMVNWILG
ncbi:MAG: prolyl oligopeptidase family serine peptidase, partial [Bryobacteraceae bacterium]